MFWNYSAFYKKILCPQKQSGFGLIELMVSISIVLLVVGIVMANQSAFNSAVLLKGEAYDLALRMREIQLNAVSVQSNTSDYRTKLGLLIDSTPARNGNYTVFIDNNNNNQFDAAPSEIFGAQGTIGARFQVNDIRVDGVDIAELHIIFERPNFDAQFFNLAGNPVAGNVAEIDITIRDTAGVGCGELRTVEVTRTGQISVTDC